MRKNQPLLVLAAGLVLIAMAVVAFFLLSGNNGGEPDVSKTVDGNKGSQSTGGTLGGPEPVSGMPASKYIPLIEEVPGENELNQSDTFTMNITTFVAPMEDRRRLPGALPAGGPGRPGAPGRLLHHGRDVPVR